MNSLAQLFPNASKKKQDDKLNDVLYIAMVDWGWSYKQFCETPIPIVMRLLKTHDKVKKAEQKAAKKK